MNLATQIFFATAIFFVFSGAREKLFVFTSFTSSTTGGSDG